MGWILTACSKLFRAALKSAIALNAAPKLLRASKYFGLNFRDFTFVGDVVKIIYLSVIKKLSNKIFNICRSKPILTNKLVEMIEKKFPNKSSKLIKKGFVKGEMLKTHGSNELLLKNIGRLSFTDIKVGIDITIREFKKNNF